MVVKTVRGKPVVDWPPFEIVWDFDTANFHRSVDGSSAAKFEATYPNGIIAADVNLAELDASFVYASQRSAQEVWTVGNEGKTEGAIWHWSAGGLMTPAMVMPYGADVVIVGGNNRLAVARAKGAARVPILFEVKHLPFFKGSIYVLDPTDRRA